MRTDFVSLLNSLFPQSCGTIPIMEQHLSHWRWNFIGLLVGDCALLDASLVACNSFSAWRRIPKSRRQAVCSTGYWPLPPRSPSPGDWSRAAHCLLPASPHPPSPSSWRCCVGFFRNDPLSSSRTASRRRRVFSRIWKRGSPRVERRRSRGEGKNCQAQPPLDLWPSTLDRFSMLPGKFSRTRASCRPLMLSLNGSKPSSRCLPTRNSELGTQN